MSRQGWTIAAMAVTFVATGAAETVPPTPRVLVDQTLPQISGRTQAELLAFDSDGVTFRIRTTLAKTAAGPKPELDRGYSLFCGNWRTSSKKTVVVTDHLAESYKYPALAADRVGEHRVTMTVTNAGGDGRPATAHSIERSYEPLAGLQLDAAAIDRLRFTCSRSNAASKQGANAPS